MGLLYATYSLLGVDFIRNLRVVKGEYAEYIMTPKLNIENILSDFNVEE